MEHETIKLIAESAAQEVGRNLSTQISGDLSRIEARLKESISHEFERHFGEMQPSEHIVQHSRLSQFLDWADETKSSFWKSLVAGVVKWALGIFLFGWFVYTVGIPK